MNPKEIALIKKVIADDEQAFQDMFHIYYGKAYAIAFRILHNDADAQDAAQETMVEVHRSIHKLNEPAYFYAWMIRIVISKCNRICRRKHPLSVDPMQIQLLKDYEEKRTYMLPQNAVENALEKEVLIGLIYSLKNDMAVVLDMMYIQQMKLKEIADTLQIPINTVKTRVVRGRKLLKQEINDYEKLEGRKLSFHVHVPLTVFVAVYYQYCKTTVKQAVRHVNAYAKGSLVQFACVVSLSVLAISGIVFKVQDYHQELSANQSALIDKDSVKQNKEDFASAHNEFVVTQYQGETIETSLDAYYTCINWARNKAEMQQKSEAEIAAIRPVYEALKQKQDQFWIQLEKQQWNIAFEAVCNP